jgi:hypothetical protein
MGREAKEFKIRRLHRFLSWYHLGVHVRTTKQIADIGKHFVPKLMRRPRWYLLAFR